MRYIAAHTTFPVPKIYHNRTGAENPTGLGPSIIMEYIEHNQNMSRELLDPTREAHERPMLDPETREDKHSLLYGQMTNTVLQLSSLKFPRIGSLADDGESISVMGRPLIVNMTDLVVHANTPQPTNLPPETHTYESAEELYTELADMHMTQPAFQKNDIADNDDMSKDQLKSRTSFRDIFTSTKLYNSAPLRDNPFLRKDASWLRMHVSDPPITVLTLHHDESAQGGSSANVGTKTYPDGFAHGRAVWPSTAIGPRGRRLFRTRSLAEERRDVILSEYWFVFQCVSIPRRPSGKRVAERAGYDAAANQG